jgi:serine phosphatase RsbU (regulator of sigma subunit)
MLVDLRSQLRSIATPPKLPVGWELQTAAITAGGDRFGGDLTVPAVTGGGRHLEIVVADVSGKGHSAGMRALMLAGAISGLLGVVPAQELLAAVNTHILRLGWEDGFASAVHVAVDLESGEFTASNAGHPPIVQYRAGNGRWELLSQEGLLLGVKSTEGTWPPVTGELEHGDALLLYTDGLTERRGESLDVGFDRLLGLAERLVVTGFDNAARRLLANVDPKNPDDCNVAFIRRT